MPTCCCHQIGGRHPYQHYGDASNTNPSYVPIGTSQSVSAAPIPAVLPTLPSFTPATEAANGLDLLVAAASVSTNNAPTAPPQGTTLVPTAVTQPGPFNPAATLPPKVVKRILDLEFIEMSEVSIDDDTSQTPGRPPAPARLPVTDISRWLERYSLMAAIICTRFPHKAGELFAYQATIVRAERNYEGKRWVTYDRQFRREALARKDLNWSITDPRLYNEAFTGRARAIARCAFCLQDDHAEAQCPKNPNRPVFGWFPHPTSWPTAAQPVLQQFPYPVNSQGPEICQRYTTRADAGTPNANIAMPARTARGSIPGWTAPAIRREHPTDAAAHPSILNLGLRQCKRASCSLASVSRGSLHSH